MWHARCKHPNAPARSEAAPPAPLRGHFLFLARRRREDRDPSPGVPHDYIVAIDVCDEPTLVVAEAAGFDEPPAAQVEQVTVHGTRYAVPLSGPLAQAGAGVVARVLDRARNSVDERD